MAVVARIPLIIASVCLVAWVNSARGELTIDGIIEELAASRGAIETLDLKYRRTEDGFSPKRGGKPYKSVRETEIGFSGHRFWKRVRVLERPVETNEQLFGSERPQLSYDGKIFRKHWVGYRMAREAEVPIGMVPLGKRSQFLGDIGFALAVDGKFPEDGYHLPGALTTPGMTYEVAPDTEPVDGVECVVLRRVNHKFADTIWLHPETGWTLRKRRMQYVGDPDRQDSFWSTLCSDFREMKPGVWLPWKVTSSSSRRKLDSDEYVLMSKTEMVVLRMEVNEPVDEALFEMVYAPGTIIDNRSAGTKVVLPGGEEILEELVVNLKSHYGWGDRARTPSGNWQWSRGLMFLTVVVIGSFAGLCFGKVWSR